MQNTANLEADSPDSERFLSQSLPVWSELYQCDLYVWMASGGKRSRSGHLNQCYWLYVEYRDRCGRSKYSSFRFQQTEKAQHFISHSLSQESLHEICPIQTSSNPIGWM